MSSSDGDALRRLARKGDVNGIKRLVQSLKGALDINSADETGRTAMHSACRKGRAGVVSFLLKCKADAEATAKDGKTPLFVAADAGREDTVRLLLSVRARVDAVDRRGWSPLRACCGHGHAAVARMLLDAKADVNKPSKKGSTPLYRAAGKGHIGTVRLLLSRRANVDAAGPPFRITPLVFAAYNNMGTVVRILVEAKADTTRFGGNSGDLFWSPEAPIASK